MPSPVTIKQRAFLLKWYGLSNEEISTLNSGEAYVLIESKVKQWDAEDAQVDAAVEEGIKAQERLKQMFFPPSSSQSDDPCFG